MLAHNQGAPLNAAQLAMAVDALPTGGSCVGNTKQVDEGAVDLKVAFPAQAALVLPRRLGYRRAHRIKTQL